MCSVVSAFVVARAMARARQVWRHIGRQMFCGHQGVGRDLFCSGACDSLGGVCKHATWRVKAEARVTRTCSHRSSCSWSSASCRSSSSRSLSSSCLCVRQRRWWMACTTCGRRMCLASSAGGERVAERIRARCVSGEPADGQPVASDSSTAAKLFDVSACCCVRACAWLARRARVVRA